MTRSLCSGLLIFVLAPAMSSSTYAQKVSDPWSDPATLVELARDWKEFDLPIAPPDAVFATGDFDRGIHVIGRPKQTDLLLILALKEANGVKPSRYWTLTGVEPLREPNDMGRFEKVDLNVVTEGRSDLPVTCAELGGRVPYLNGPLAMAVQAQLRNQPKLALSLLKLGAQFELTGFHRPGLHSIPTSPPEPRRALATLAWSFWRDQLTEPNNDRTKTLDRLQRVIKSPMGPDVPLNRQLIEDLKTTQSSRPETSDPIEALIDELTNMDQREGFGISGGFKGSADLTDVDPRYRVLWLKGFEAVPALLNHLDDGRLTRRDYPYINGPSERNARISDIVSDILMDLSAGALQPRNSNDGRGNTLQPKDARAWWTTAQAAGERGYLLDHVLPPQAPVNRFPRPAMPEPPNMPEDVKARYREMEERMKRADTERNRDSCLPRAHLLHIIAAKYPEELPKLFKHAHEHCPQAPQHLLCELLAQSPVKPEIKTQLLQETARSDSPEVRYAAVLALSRMTGPASCAAVAEGLSSIPLKWEKGEMCKMATRWTRLVTECDDANNWTKLEDVARRCDAGQRIEILWAMNCCDAGCSNRPRRIEFLGRFLDDESVREGGSWSIFDAGLSAKRLTVRDAAAYTIATILSISPRPQMDADDAEWASFRAHVRAALEKENQHP